MPLDKEALRECLLEQVRGDLAALIRTQADASEGATHAENRAEHAKDTRATEQSYLARGLADRVEALRADEARLAQLPLPAASEDDAVAAGALVRVEAEATGEREIWWLLPVAGGRTIEADGETVRTITPGTPLGQALLGRQTGDACTLRTPRDTRTLFIDSIE